MRRTAGYLTRMQEKGCHRSATTQSKSAPENDYNMEESAGPVETEDSLNAGHCVEPLRDRQPCAIALGIPEINRARKTVALALLLFNVLVARSTEGCPVIAPKPLSKRIVSTWFNAL